MAQFVVIRAGRSPWPYEGRASSFHEHFNELDQGRDGQDEDKGLQVGQIEGDQDEVVQGIGKHGSKKHNKGYGCPMPRELLKFLETPKKEHMPRNRDKMMLLTKMELNKIPKILSPINEHLLSDGSS